MRIKIMLIALAVVLAGMTAFSVIYVGVNGKNFTDTVYYYSEDENKKPKLKVESNNEDIIMVKDFHLSKEDPDQVVISLYSVGSGDATVSVICDGCEYDAIYGYYVNDLGTIFSRMSLSFTGFELIEWDILAGITLVAVTMLICFINHLRRAKYSYSMIAFGGLFLFCVFMITFTIYEISGFNDFSFFLRSLLNAAPDLAYYSAPVMLIFCLTVSFSNIWLIRHEGFRPQNMLGIALGLAWGLAFMGVFFSAEFLYTEINFYVANNILCCVMNIISFMECLLAATIICAFISTRHKPAFDRDYLVILGCCIRNDGTPTPILRGRIDAAVNFEKKQFAATGKHAKFVPSGGQGSDEIISESESMKRYLMEQGYPEEQIIKEDKSVNTDQNIQFSRDRIREDAGTLENIKAGVATTNYHIFRSYVLSKKHGLDAEGISAKTKVYFFPNAFLREFVGLLVDRKWKILAVLVIILISYIMGERLLSHLTDYYI